MSLESMWNDVKNFFKNDFLDVLLDILLATIVLVVGLLLIKLVFGFIKYIVKKKKAENVTQTFVVSVTRMFAYVLLFVLVLTVAGVDLTGILAALTAVGLAVALSLQNSFSNLASGMILISTKPFSQGDFISIDGVEGIVKNIKIMTTKIVTRDQKEIIIPNSNVVNNKIINFNTSKYRRVDFRFTVAYDTNVELVKKIILRVINSCGEVLTDKEIFVAVDKLDQNGIELFGFAWCDNEDFFKVYFYVMEHVFNEFKRYDISIPYQQVEVRMRTDEVELPFDEAPLPKRKEKVRKKTKPTGMSILNFNYKEKNGETKKIKKPKVKARKIKPHINDDMLLIKPMKMSESDTENGDVGVNDMTDGDD